MRIPEFFILGGIRCGSTSLRMYLRGHPRIFMPRYEPRFFSTDLVPGQAAKLSEAEYLALFTEAGEQHLAVGEGSPLYLYSAVAVPNILRFNPQARFFVLLRSPVDMLQSVHARYLYDGQEDVASLEQAWRLQDERQAGRHLPRFCYEPKELHYGNCCRLGAQLARLYQRVPRERVHVIFYDDLKARAKEVYEAALAFLGVPSDARERFPAYMQNAERRWHWLNGLLLRVGKVKAALGIDLNLGLATRLDRLNTVPTRRAPLRPEFRRELVDYFRDDVRLLEELTGRNLGHWLDGDTRDPQASRGPAAAPVQESPGIYRAPVSS